MSHESIQVPLLESETLQDLVEYAVSFSAANGLQVQAPLVDDGKTGRPKKTYVTAPISLLPQSYPAHLFAKGIDLARPLNELVDKISRDGEFLKETLKDVRTVDEYTGKLLDFYEEIYLGERKGSDWGKHARQADRLGILRSDYMLHQTAPGGEYALKQVELNTIASSFAGLASTVARLHGFLTQRMKSDGRLNEFLEENHKCVTRSDSCTAGGIDGVPDSPSMTQLPLAMSIAHERYCQRYMGGQDSSSVNFRPTVLFVVQPNETNTVDQRLFEFALWKNHQIPVVRMSLNEIFEKTKLDEDTGRLLIQSDHGATQEEVTVVYFRAGYAPSDYPSGYNIDDGSGVEWLARERLERSRSTKCPCLGYHLAGTKKVQQELARRNAVERFFPENVDNTAQQIRTVFAGLYSLGADATQQDIHAVRDVLFHGGEGRYVLKPQREGGGYNYYGKNLADKLRENCTIVENYGDEEKEVQLAAALSEFILMERLFPPQQRAILLRNGQVEGTGMTISELGCFGAIVATKDSEIVHNDYGGFLLRTKFSGVDEGGVASGFATLSSPYLC
ncbi:hypothetical protein ACHAW6_003105 [Cyclotella cf. meneghiniana]